MLKTDCIECVQCTAEEAVSLGVCAICQYDVIPNDVTIPDVSRASFNILTEEQADQLAVSCKCRSQNQLQDDDHIFHLGCALKWMEAEQLK